MTRHYYLSERCWLKFAVLFLWGATSLTRGRVCRLQSITQWSESRGTRKHTLRSPLRLPQPGVPGSRIYIPRNRVVKFYPRALDSIYVASYDSHGCCGGILTLPHRGSSIYRLHCATRRIREVTTDSEMFPKESA
jgi:hypothetical protein